MGGMGESLAGFYFDAKHGGCLRRIVRRGDGRFKVLGVHGDDEDPPHQYWYAMVDMGQHALGAASEEYSLAVDFSGKPSKKAKKMKATWNRRKRCIYWEDGNTWQKLFVHWKQFSPMLASR